MPTNEPSDLPVDCTVETTQQQDVVDYRTVEAGGLSAAKQTDSADKSLGDNSSSAQDQRQPAEIPGGSQAKYSHELVFAIAVSVIFTLVATLQSGNLPGLLTGFSLSGLLTAYWAYLNYRICKDNQVSIANGVIRRGSAVIPRPSSAGPPAVDPGGAVSRLISGRMVSTVSPMRCLAMSVFANQFGVAHAALFANSVLELIFPVLRTIRPPDLVMTFANCVGGAFAFLVVVVVAVLTVWWHIVLAKEVYGARSQASVVKAAALGCMFAATATWLLITVGSSDFFTTAPIAVNCCFVFVFMFARLIILEREQPALPNSTPGAPTSPAAQESPEVLSAPGARASSPLLNEPISATSAVASETASLPIPQRKDLTAEWLLLLTYVLTVYLSNPLAVSYGIFASLFSGVPAAVWFVYLLMETRSGARLSAVNQTHTV